jgi:hypothetical protein
MERLQILIITQLHVFVQFFYVYFCCGTGKKLELKP